MSEVLETHEHAEHAAEGGRRHTALLIAVLAAGLAFTEQGAQHADTKMSESALAAADLWAQYQAKSIRANEARNISDLAATLPGAENPARAAMLARLNDDIARFQSDPRDGKEAIAAHAKKLEADRDAAHHRLEAFDNASAALQLGIVLTTASVITGSALLVWCGSLVGLLGGILAVLGVWRPEFAAF